MSPDSIQRIQADGHSLVFGTHCLAEFAEKLSSDEFAGVKLFILADENTLQNCLHPLIAKVGQLAEAEVIEVTPGEESKSIEVCTRLWEVLGELRADRSSVLINLGGGVVTDLGGFIAGTFKRGIRFFNLPTSLLAQVDASIGGKVGLNLGGLKNEVGLFYDPEGVYIDPEFLSTLPRDHMVSGFAEMIKHALVSSPEYWKEILQVSFFETESLHEAIFRSIRIKNEIVLSDRHEAGPRKILNFGHTIGHALESYSHESDVRNLLHGEAVAAGMICAAFISHRFKLLNEKDLHAITSYIFSHFAKIKIERTVYHRIVELMRHDKKNFEGEIQMTLLNGIGDAVINKPVRADQIIESLNFYQRWTG